MNNEIKPADGIKSLNDWRKYYLIILWVLSICIFLAITFSYIIGSKNIDFGMIVLAGLLVALTAWSHNAIVNRKVIHLKAIAFINLIPFFNIIGTIITLSIIRKTREEINK